MDVFHFKDPVTVSSVAPDSVEAAEPIKDLEAASPTKAQPVRKISRFLVSPAILTVTNEKNIQVSHVDETVTSQVNQPPPPTPPVDVVQTEVSQVLAPVCPPVDADPVQIEHSQSQSQSQSYSYPFQQTYGHIDINQTAIDFVKHVVDANLGEEIANASEILTVHPHLTGKIAEFISAVNPDGAQFMNTTEMLSQSNAIDAKEFIQQQLLKKPLGPDHINTLEQLKIELENITHVHMMNKYLAETEDSSATVTSAGQLSPEMTMNQQMLEGIKILLNAIWQTIIML